MKIQKQQYVTDERLQAGYVIVLPGIEGYSFLNRRIVKGLINGGLPYAVEIYDWTCRWRIRIPMFLYNLRSRKLHALEATEIGEKIQRYQQEHPNCPVYLIGHSGGGGMAILALEQLPPDASIEGAILLGPAISPHYGVEKALSRVKRRIWNLSSLGDCLFLGLMTLCGGTIDGRHGCCAGMMGFEPVHATDPGAEKLVGVPFRREFLRCGNWGGHFGYTAPRFVQQFLVPLLTGGEPKLRQSLETNSALQDEPACS